MELMPDSPECLPEPPAWPARLRGFTLVLLSVLLLGALLSYRAEEVSWAWLHPTAHPAEPCSNALGLIGLYTAGMLYWLLGAGALYTALLGLLLGFDLLLHPRAVRGGQLPALLGLVLCACAALAVQPYGLREWAQARGLVGSGGYLGYLDGSCLLEPLLGQTGALCLLVAAHWCALLYFSRLNFRSFAQGVAEDSHRLAAWWHSRREQRAERRQAEQLAWQQRALAAHPSAPEEPEEAAPTPEPRPTLPPRSRGSLWEKRHAQSTEPEPVPLSDIEPMVDPVPTFEDAPLPEAPHPAPAPEPSPEPPPEPSRTNASPAAQPRRGARAIRADRPNLLTLMEQVEEEIALTADHDCEPFTDPAPRRREAPRPDARAESRPAPHRTPAAEERSPARRRSEPSAPPRPQPAPIADERPQEADYPLPPYELLKYEPISEEMNEAVQAEMAEMQQRIIDTLASFRIEVTPGDITRGPSITRYEFFPPSGLLMSKFESLDKNLMQSTRSSSINILAPVPGKDTVAIELANARKTPVYLRELLQSPAFRNPKLHIPVALGKDVYGNAVIGDLARMPHTLVAGTTGSGKSVCINSMILSMLYKFRPDELRLILVDPKVVEMQPYRKLPHLACPVVTNPARVIGALRWAVNEMEKRYAYFSRVGVRNFVDFNARDPMLDPDTGVPEEEVDEDYYATSDVASDIVREIEDSNDGRDLPEEEETQGEFDFDAGEPLPRRLPYVVIIIDELADLMQQVKEDLENYISRLTQKARAAGIHLVAATQTPRSNVVTGTIKANIPSRIALKVASPLDSRIILETKGAENLLGNGDLLFLPPGGISQLTRVQGAFVSDAEIQQIIAWCASHAKQHFEQSVTAEMNNADGAPAPDNDRTTSKGLSEEDNELYNRCVSVVIAENKASTSLLQRRLRIGYGRASAMMDLMEAHGIIGPSLGPSRPREVLAQQG